MLESLNNTCAIWILFSFPVNAGYSTIIFEPTREIRFDKVWLTDAADWCVLDIRDSEQYVRRRWRLGLGC
jgi:hypothetical protein